MLTALNETRSMHLNLSLRLAHGDFRMSLISQLLAPQLLAPIARKQYDQAVSLWLRSQTTDKYYRTGQVGVAHIHSAISHDLSYRIVHTVTVTEGSESENAFISGINAKTCILQPGIVEIR